MSGGWLRPYAGRFTPGKEPRYPLYRRVGGPQSKSRMWCKIPSTTGFDPWTVQPLASRYTDNFFLNPNFQKEGITRSALF